MSESVSIGLAAIASSACQQLIKGVSCVKDVSLKTVDWLSSKAQDEIERLEKEMESESLNKVVSEDVEQEFLQLFNQVKIKIASNPLVSENKEHLARIIALKHSTIGSFVGTEHWQNLLKFPTSSNNAFQNVFSNAQNVFSKANIRYISQAIVEVAQKNGFSTLKMNRLQNGVRFMVLADQQGRATVARIAETGKGAQVKLDLTGFGGKQCDKVMDSLIEGLAQKQIHLQYINRRSLGSGKAITPQTETPIQSKRPIKEKPVPAKPSLNRKIHAKNNSLKIRN